MTTTRELVADFLALNMACIVDGWTLECERKRQELNGKLLQVAAERGLTIYELLSVVAYEFAVVGSNGRKRHRRRGNKAAA